MFNLPEDIPDAVWRQAEDMASQRGFDELDECWWPVVSRYAGELMAEHAPKKAAAFVTAAAPALVTAAPVVLPTLGVAAVVVGVLWWCNRH